MAAVTPDNAGTASVAVATDRFRNFSGEKFFRFIGIVRGRAALKWATSGGIAEIRRERKSLGNATPDCSIGYPGCELNGGGTRTQRDAPGICLQFTRA